MHPVSREAGGVLLWTQKRGGKNKSHRPSWLKAVKQLCDSLFGQSSRAEHVRLGKLPRHAVFCDDQLAVASFSVEVSSEDLDGILFFLNDYHSIHILYF